MKAFEKFTPPDQKELQTIVKKNGGPKGIIDDDYMLENLLKKHPPTAGSTDDRSASRTAKAYTLTDLKEDLIEDVDTALDKNLKRFTQKFKKQQEQITEEITGVVEQQGDRIIAAMNSGPHDKIRNKVCG